MDYLNLSNLVTPEATINETKSNSLVISSNYDLLSNDQRTVSWNPDGTISIKRPAGLSNLKKIRFRGFKSKQLPYTSLELPTLKVSVITDIEGNNRGDIDGPITVWGNHFNSELVRNDLNGNVLFRFTKAWTYDSGAESQIDYNIQECVEEVNRRMKERYPLIGSTVLVDVGLNTWGHIEYPDYLEIPTAGSYQFIAKKSDYKTVFLLWPTKENPNNTIELDLSVFYTCVPAIATMDFDGKIIGVCVEQQNLTANIVYYNDGSFESPAWSIIYSSSWQKNTAREISLISNPKRIPYALGRWDDNSCLITSEQSTGTNLILIYAYNNGAWAKFFIDPIIQGENYVCYSLATTDSWCYLLLFVYTANGEGTYAVPQIYKFSKTLLVGSTVSGPFRLNNAGVTTYYADSDAFQNWTISKFWTDKIRHGTSGKETYGIAIKNGTADNISNADVNFVGTFICSIRNNKITHCVESFVYKHRASAVLGKDCFVKVPNGYGLMNYSDIVAHDYSAVIGSDGAYRDVQLYRATNLPILQMGNLNNCLMLGSFYIGNTEEALQMNEYVGNDTGLANAFNARQSYVFNLFSRTLPGLKPLVNRKDGYATSYYADFFVYENTGVSANVISPQFDYEDGLSMNLMIVIETEPFYFMCYTPVAFYAETGASITHVAKELVFNQLNPHVLSTMEMLILLRYEFNEIELICPTFPNGDGVVFHSNEESQVEFKEMTTDNTQDCINLQLVSGDEILQLDVLKELYGGMTLSVDWVS